ncbi:DNA-3-methyladenine glycosylase I [Nocardioides limicola]|uniref:DNA-3-methyladenine glycosylase I n=1 Tax=Nocardioides limicola TaxID=2803368 RepID=UPI0027DAFE72|nr:DNA-3-methyladenine glycosylase I [Nocardioides sp. DJM-14]
MTPELARCAWATTPGPMQDYHDREWGVPVTGEAALFERLSLEAFQSGLSWATILAKRPAFREAFDGFVPDLVAEYDATRRADLLADVRIVRNAAKIDATIGNARAVIELRGSGGLEELVARFRPASDPEPTRPEEVPTSSVESTALSKELKRHGFRFVGPTTMHALMEAIGLVDTHLVGCHRRGCGR